MTVTLYNYIVSGEPIAIARCTETESPRIWDAYKQRKFNYEQILRNQHDGRPCIDGPVEVKATFFMKIYTTHNHDELVTKCHTIQPNLLSLFNFCEHSLLGIVFKRDCQIVSTTLKKIYDNKPRTEIRVKKL